MLPLSTALREPVMKVPLFTKGFGFVISVNPDTFIVAPEKFSIVALLLNTIL